MMILIKNLFIIGFIIFNLEFYSSVSVERKKRDNEAILYGNQQGSPHKSLKKSGPSHSFEPHSVKKKSNFEKKEVSKKSNELDLAGLQRAKRSLVKQSIENSMGSQGDFHGMLRRKKRSLEDGDDEDQEGEVQYSPEQLADIQKVLSDMYDSYYNGGNDERSEEDNDERAEFQPVIMNQDEIPYQVVEERQEPIVEEPISKPMLEKMILQEAAQEEAEKRNMDRRKRWYKRAEAAEEAVKEAIREEEAQKEADQELMKDIDQNIIRNGYQMMEVDGIPGIFMPFTMEDFQKAAMEEAAEQAEKRRRRKRDGTEIMDEAAYNKKLEKLAQMLAEKRK